MTSLADATLRGYPWRRVGYGLRRLATQFRSSVSRRGVPAARVPKLIFDPLEPRLLLNADAQVLALNLNALPANTPHDVVVQMINEVANANSQIAAQPQVEIVAASNPNQVLWSSGPLSQNSALKINITGTGNDQVTINAASFAFQNTLSISFAGNGANETLAISNSVDQNNQPQINSWFIGQDASGAASGTIEAGTFQVGFSGATALQGAGSDTLYGSTTDTKWTISGSGSGTVSDIAFSGFANLAGATNNNNVFTVATTDLWNGTISGGGKGTIANESGASENWILGGGGTGAVDAGAIQLFAFAGMDNLQGGGGDTLIGAATDNSWTLSGAGSGTVGALAFSGFGNLVGAGAENNVFTVTSAGILGGSINGGGLGTIVNDTGVAQSWTLESGSAGYMTNGAAQINFSGIADLQGAGNDTLTGNTADNAWTLSGPGAGTVGTPANAVVFSFSGFANLTGPGSENNIFVVAAGGSLSGSLDGGGNGTLIGSTSDTNWTISGSDSGTVSGTAGSLVFTGFANLIGSIDPGNIFNVTPSGSLTGSIAGGSNWTVEMGGAPIVSATGGVVTTEESAGSTSSWSILGFIQSDTGGTVSGVIGIDGLEVDFAGATTLVGGGGDTLTGSTEDTNWVINGLGSGTLGPTATAGSTSAESIAFSGFANLVAAAGANGAPTPNNVFTVTSTGSLLGTINGNGAGTIVNGSGTGESWYLQGYNVGYLTGNAGQIFFSGVDDLEGSGGDTLTGATLDTNWTISGAGSGTTGAGTVASITFSGFANLAGAGGQNNVFSLTPNGSLTGGIDGGGDGTLIGSTADTTWTLSGSGSGIVGATAFTGFANLVGASGEDNVFTIGAAGSLLGAIAGGGAATIVNDSGTAENWMLQGGGAGSVSAGATQLFSFLGIDDLQGGGLDTLTGPTADTNWIVSGAGAGTVGAVAFSGFANLASAAGTDDVFTLTANSSLTGSIDGGGNGTLVGATKDTNWTISGPGSGTVGPIAFSGFANLVGPANEDNVFTVTSTGSLTGSIDGGDDWSVVIGGEVSVFAADGVVTAEVTQPSQSDTWYIENDSAGAAGGYVEVGALHIGFSGATALRGSGADTLYGSTTDIDWTVSGAGAGTVGAVAFSGFANLIGAAATDDVFTLTASGSLTGSIDGGGDGTLIGATTDTDWTISGPGSGTVGAIAFSGFADLVGPASEDNVFTVTSTGSLTGSINGGTEWTVLLPGETVSSAGGVVAATGGANSWSIDSDANGAASGTIAADGLRIDFSGATKLQGSGSDTLRGSTADTAWTLSGSGSGTVSSIAFGGFANLVGAANEDDVFTLTPSGSLSGSIQGGGDGTLIGASTDTNWTISGAGSGTVGSLAFSGFADLVGAADEDNVFSVTSSGSLTGSIDGGSAWSVVIGGVIAASAVDGVVVASDILPGQADVWSIENDVDGTASGSFKVGALRIDFSGATALQGGGSDTLYGSTSDTNWTLNGAGSGSVGGVTFSGFADLVGAANVANSFVVTSAGGFTGSIDGGSNWTVQLPGETISSLDGLITAADGINSWHIDSEADGAASGTIDVGGLRIDFSGATSLQGSGVDTLYGSTTDTAWTLSGSGSGTVGAIAFSGFANLVGAANEANVFTLTPSGSLAGSIQGGGDGTLIGSTADTDWTISGAGSGIVDSIAFGGFANLVGAADADNVFSIAPDGSLTGSIDGGSDWSVLIGGSIAASAAGGVVVASDTLASQSDVWSIASDVNGIASGTLKVGALLIDFSGATDLQGGGGDTLYGSATDTDWTLSGAGSGTVGATGVDRSIAFGGFANLFGAAGEANVFTLAPGGSLGGSIQGGGDGTLVGSTADTTWTVSGAGSGTVDSIAFSGFANLKGAAGQNDVFTVTSTGSLTGTIDGGGEGTLTVDVGAAPSLVSQIEGPSSPSGPPSFGSDTYNGQTITYTGIRSHTVTDPPTVAINLTGNEGLIPTQDFFTLYYDSTPGDAHVGDLVLEDVTNNSFSYYAPPTTSLTINIPDATNVNSHNASGADFLDIESLPSNFAASVYVNLLYSGYDPFAGGGLLPSSAPGATIYSNSLFVTGNLATNGGSVDLVANNTYIGTQVATQSNVSGSFSTEGIYTGVSGSGGHGSGMTADVFTDASGNPIVLITNPGSNYQAGDKIDFSAGGGTVEMTYQSSQSTQGIDTVNAAGASGSITLGMVGTVSVSPGGAQVAGGTNVVLGPNAVLNAQSNGITSGVNKGSAGAIAIGASDIGQRLISAPVDYTTKSATITIEGATIEGGSITIGATAQDTNISTDAPSSISSFTGTLASLLNQVPGVVLGSFLGIDLSVVLRGANAIINVDNSTITSSGSVSIKSTTAVTTQVAAITTGLGLVATASGVSFAAAYGQATSDCEVNILGDTTITAQQSVTVAANGTTTDNVQAYADSNVFTGKTDTAFASKDINPNAVTVALAGAYTNLTVLATVASGASITSMGGNINVDATGKQTTKPDARTYSPVDGAGGVAVGLDWEVANVEASVSGTLKTESSQGTVGVDNSDASTFSNSNLINDQEISSNAPLDTINVSDSGFSTGELVVYQPEYSTFGGPGPLWLTPNSANAKQISLGGLTPGSTYAVLVTPDGDIQLTKVGPINIAAINTDLSADQTLNVIGNTAFTTDGINTSNNAISLPAYGFSTGDVVKYTLGSDTNGTAIFGLTNNTSYEVVSVDDADFQLEDTTTGQIVTISQTDPNIAQINPNISAEIALGTQNFQLTGYYDSAGVFHNNSYLDANDQLQTVSTGTVSDLNMIASVDLGYVYAATDTVYVQNIASAFGSNYTIGGTIEVNYQSFAEDGANAITGLTNQSYYTLVANTENTFQLYPDNTTNPNGVTPEQIGDPGGPAVQLLSFIAHTVTFNPVPISFTGSGSANTLLPVSDANGTSSSGAITDGETLSGSSFTGGVDSTTDDLVLSKQYLQNAGLPNGLPNGTPVIYEADPNLQVTELLVFELNAINSVTDPTTHVTTDTITIPNNGLANGALVTYAFDSSATAITGLNTADTYKVVDVNPQTISGASYSSSDTFELFDTTTNSYAQFSQGSATGTQNFVDAADNITASVTLALVSGDTITIGGNGFPAGGYAVNYATLSGAGITNLTDGGAYTLMATGANTFKLVGSPSSLTVGAGTSVVAIASTAYYQASGFVPGQAANASVAFELDAVNSSANTIYIPGNGLTNGATVTYQPGTNNSAITGLTVGGTYIVEDYNPTTGQLDASLTTSDYFSLFLVGSNGLATGSALPISQGNALGTQTFTDSTNSVTATVNLAKLDTNPANVGMIEIGNVGFTATTAQSLNFEVLSGTTIGGLNNGAVYQISAVAGTNEIKVTDSSGNAVALTDPGSASALAFANLNGQGTIGDLTRGDVPISGLVNGDTYYVVSAGFDSQGDQIIRLVSDMSLVSADAPITLSAGPSSGTFNGGGLFGAVQYALTDSTLTDGIGVNATLTTANTVKVQPQVGGKLNKEVGLKNSFSRSDLALSTLFGSGQANSGTTGAKDENGKDIEIKNDSLSLGGGVGILYTNNNVNADVGKNGTALLETPDNVDVSASSEQTYQQIVQSDVSKPKTSKGGKTGQAAVDLAFAVGVLNNTADAKVYGDASINAGETVNVTSELMYPFVTQPSELDSAQAFGNFIVSQGASFFMTDLLDGTFGLGTLFLNDWVVARAKAAGTSKDAKTGVVTQKFSQAAAVAISIAVNYYNNNAQSIVELGAQINQGTGPLLNGKTVTQWTASPSQSVSVTANVAMDIIESAGIGKTSLNTSPIGKSSAENKGLQELWSGGDIIDPYGRSGSSASGGAVLLDLLNDNVFAEIEGGAAVSTGPAATGGSLTLDATENVFHIALATSGALTGPNSKFGFAGSGVILVDNSNIQAGLVTTSSLGPTITGGGNLNITATTGVAPQDSDQGLILPGIELEIAGALVNAGTGANGIGFSLVVNDITTNVEAFIGTDPTPKSAGGSGLDPTSTTEAGQVSVNAGNTTIEAKTDGIWVGVVATASVLGGPSEQPVGGNEQPLAGANPPEEDEDAEQETQLKSGFGFAGSVGINVMSEDDLAYINAIGNIQTGTLSLDSEITPVIVLFAGGAAFSLSDSKSADEGGTAIGGALVVNQITTKTESFIADYLSDAGDALTITSTGADSGSTGAVSLEATRGGTLATFAAAISANTNAANGNAVAASISIDRLVDTTETIIDGATLNVNNGSADLNALNNAQVIAIAGAGAGTTSAKGVGISLAYNQLSGNTQSGILGTDRRGSVTLGGNLNVTSINDQTLWAFAVSIGVSTGQAGTAVAFTVAVNIVSTSQTVFTRNNSNGVLALLKNANVTASGVSLQAKDGSVIYAVAGALGIGTQGQGYGAGLGWNQIAVVVEANVDNASVTAGAGGISLSAISTEDGPISPAGKIAAAAIGAAGSGGSSGATGSGNAIGASVSVNGTYDTIEATVTGGSRLVTSGGGNVDITANDGGSIDALTGGAAISTNSNAVGAAIGANYIADEVTTNVDSSTIQAAGSVDIEGEETAGIYSLTIGAAGGDNVAIGASVSINVIDDPVTASITGASSYVSAQNNLTVYATNTANIVAIAGSLGIGVTKAGVGVSITNVDIIDTTDAYIDGAATVSANGLSGSLTDVLGNPYQGVSIQANSDENVVILAVGGAFSKQGAGTGAVSFTYIDATANAYEASPSGTPTTGVGGVGGTGGITSGEDVDIAAQGTVTVVGIAGALAGSGNVAVGIGSDAGDFINTVAAYIAPNAQAVASRNVIVAAYDDATLTSVSAAGAIVAAGSGGTFTLTAGVTVLDLTTLAYIGSDATVFAKNNVLVSAEDDTTLNQVSGNLAGGGSGAVGIAAGVGVVTKNTDAYIDTGAKVTAEALSGPGITANTGAFSAPAGGADTQDTGDAQSFAAADVTYGTVNGVQTAIFNVPSNGFTNGQAVIYTAQSTPLGGLQTGHTYYIVQITAGTYAGDFVLSDTQNGSPVAVDNATVSSGNDPTSVHILQTINNTGVPSISTSSLPSNIGNELSENKERTPVKALQTGVIVVAVSVNDITSAGVGVAIAKTGSGAIAGSVTVDTINTLAYINEGAQINVNNTVPGTSVTLAPTALQNVTVAAGRSYNDLSIGVGLAGSGTFSAAPGFVVPILNGTTDAFIGAAPNQASSLVTQPSSGSIPTTNVSAEGSVFVNAQSLETVLGIGAGIALSGNVGIGGSAAVIVMDTSTIASIVGPVVVDAEDNVVVDANDDSTTYAIGGAVGVGISTAGGAGAVNVTSIAATVLATISDGAAVNANGNGAGITHVPDGTLNGSTFGTQTPVNGVVVLANSSQNVVSIDGSVGVGQYLGIAGAVSVELLNVNTQATIGDDLGDFGITSQPVTINESPPSGTTASTNQDVIVAATNTLNIFTVAGAIGGSLGGGIGASVDIGMLENETTALIGSGAIKASNETDVFALSDWTVNSNAVSLGAGLVGIGGGIIVYTIGGAFNSGYSSSGHSSSALSGNSNSTVLQFVDDTIGSLNDAIGTNDSLPSFDPSTAVSNNSIDLGSNSLVTGDPVTYHANGGTPITGLTDGQTYYAIVNGSNPNQIQLASSLTDADNDRALNISYSGPSGSQQLSFGNAGLANSARSTISGQSPSNTVDSSIQNPDLISGTTAGIAAGAVITTGTLDIEANSELNYNGIAGAVAVGGGALGVGLAVLYIDTPVTAYIAPHVNITGKPSHDLTVAATLNSTIDQLGAAGAVSGFVSLAGAVSLISDSSSAEALLGATPVDNGNHFNEGDGDTITGFRNVSVTSNATITHNLCDAEAAVSGFGGLGAAVTTDTITGDSQAVIGEGTVIGTAPVTNQTTGVTTPAVAIAGGVTVNAGRTITVGPYPGGFPFGIAIGGGAILGLAAGASIISVSGTVNGSVDDDAQIYASGDVTIESSDTITAGTSSNPLYMDGVAIGGIAVGFIIAEFTIKSTVEANIGESVIIRGRSLDLSAINTTTSYLNGVAAGGGVLSGQGLNISLEIDPTTSISVGNSADINVTGSVSATSTATTTANATGDAGNYGGVVVIIGGATTNLNNTNTATVGAGASIIGGTSVTVKANSTNDGESTGDGGADGLVPIIQASATTNESDDTSTTIGTATGAAVILTALSGDLDVEAITSGTGKSTPTATAGGLGASTTATGTLTYNGTTTTTVNDAQLTSTLDNVNVLSRVTTLDLEVTTTATSSALGATSTATSTIQRSNSKTPTSDSEVTIGGGALVTGGDQVNIKATHEFDHQQRVAQLDGQWIWLLHGQCE